MTTAADEACNPAYGMTGGGVWWRKAHETTGANICLGEFYRHADAVAACSALGTGWSLPTKAQGDGLLAAQNVAQKSEWWPKIGNGGGSCTLSQVGLNGVWWLSDHNGASAGAAIFASNSGSVSTTGLSMGDIFYYRARCVYAGC